MEVDVGSRDGDIVEKSRLANVMISSFGRKVCGEESGVVEIQTKKKTWLRIFFVRFMR